MQRLQSADHDQKAPKHRRPEEEEGSRAKPQSKKKSDHPFRFDLVHTECGVDMWMEKRLQGSTLLREALGVGEGWEVNVLRISTERRWTVARSVRRLLHCPQ